MFVMSQNRDVVVETTGSSFYIEICHLGDKEVHQLKAVNEKVFLMGEFPAKIKAETVLDSIFRNYENKSRIFYVPKSGVC